MIASRRRFFFNEGILTLKDSASVFDNTTTSIGGGIDNDGTVNACDGTSVDEWIGRSSRTTPTTYSTTTCP